MRRDYLKLIQEGKADVAEKAIRRELMKQNRTRMGEGNLRETLSFAVLEQGQNDEAIREARQAIKLAPLFWISFHVLAVAFARKGKMEQALRAIERGIKKHPYQFSLRLDKALLLMDTRPYKEVLQAAKEALCMNPNNDVALKVVRTALARSGCTSADSEAAERHIRKEAEARYARLMDTWAGKKRPRKKARGTVKVIGLYPVRNGKTPCHLVELAISDCHATLDAGAFTQEDPKQPPYNWQVAWDERVLNSDGTRFVGERWPRRIECQGDIRIVFFMHCLDPNRPLLTPCGPIELSAAKRKPRRLGFVRYEPPD